MDDHNASEMLIRWRRNCLRSQIANYNSANRSANRNYFLGIPTVILSAIVATSVFAALGQKPDLYIQLTVGSASVIAAALAALQTFLRLDELALKYRATAAEYGAIKRLLDQEIVNLEGGEVISRNTIDNIRQRMDALSKEGPVIPKGIWAKARIATPTTALSSRK